MYGVGGEECGYFCDGMVGDAFFTVTEMYGVGSGDGSVGL